MLFKSTVNAFKVKISLLLLLTTNVDFPGINSPSKSIAKSNNVNPLIIIFGDFELKKNFKCLFEKNMLLNLILLFYLKRNILKNQI